MKFYFSSEVIKAFGYQIWSVDAKNEDDAKKMASNWLGVEFVEEELEVLERGDLEFIGSTRSL